jgi:hypothetical protein
MQKREMHPLLTRVRDKPTTKPCRSAQAASSVSCSFKRFQIGLPPGKFGIILRADRHYPVVPANTQK